MTQQRPIFKDLVSGDLQQLPDFDRVQNHISCGFPYKRSTVTTSTPASGYLQTNTLTLGAVTYLYLSYDTLLEYAIYAPFWYLKSGDMITIRVLDASDYVQFLVTGAVTFNSEFTGWIIPVSTTAENTGYMGNHGTLLGVMVERALSASAPPSGTDFGLDIAAGARAYNIFGG